MERFSFEDNTQEESLGIKILDSHLYWNKKRLLFNIIIGLSGLICIVLFSNTTLGAFDIFGIIAWGVVANAFYSTGYVIESLVISRSRGKKSLKRNRTMLFWLGTIAYAILSFVFAFNYFVLIPD